MSKKICIIIGTKKSNSTKKALRFCKERDIAHQFLDLNERVLSPGELKNIARGNYEQLIDVESAYYRKEGYQYRDFEAEEELLEHPELLKIPVVRFGGKVAVQPELQDLQALMELK